MLVSNATQPLSLSIQVLLTASIFSLHRPWTLNLRVLYNTNLARSPHRSSK